MALTVKVVFGYNFQTYIESSDTVISELGYMYYENFEALAPENFDGTINWSVAGIE